MDESSAVASSNDYVRDIRINEHLSSLMTSLMIESRYPSRQKSGIKQNSVTAVESYLRENYKKGPRSQHHALRQQQISILSLFACLNHQIRVFCALIKIKAFNQAQLCVNQMCIFAPDDRLGHTPCPVAVS